MFPFTQLVELLVVLCTIDHYRYGFSIATSALAHAHAKSGSVRPDTVTTFASGIFFTALQVMICHLVSIVYVLTVIGTGLRQPSWMNAFALPDAIFGIELGVFWTNVLRVLACISIYSIKKIANSVFKHLGDQYHLIGRREKSRVVQTGPYTWVRHPLYALALLQAAFQCVAFWSYAPLFAIVAIAIVFSVKIQVEEEIIQREDGIREEYRAYMRKVPARLVPYVW